MRPTGGRFEDHDDEVVDVRWFPIAEALRHMAYPNERAMLEAEAARIPELLRDGGREDSESADSAE
jgi:hypothetical protein